MQHHQTHVIWIIAFFIGIFRPHFAIADELEDAKAAYRDGVTSFSKGEYDTALAYFTDAYNLSGKPEILYNLAVCQEKLGQTDHAIAYFELYLEELPDAEDAAAVRQKVAQLKDPEAAAKAAEEERKANAAKAEEVRKKKESEEAQKSAMAKNTGPSKDGPLKVIAPPDPNAHRTYVQQGVLLGIGGLFIVTGGVTATVAYQNYKDFKDTCAPTCSKDKVQRVKRLGVAADIQFGIGLAAITTGVIWKILTYRRKKALESRGPFSLHPLLTPSQGGLAVTGRF
ncbi:MAG: tetratricopeptide repeat protein [Deltaproteobacteria bacterium]|nr:tetratricopeptide repeat protein [Deltaproteobacteria bacterium]